MKIRRAREESHFTILANDTLRGHQLSFRARGLLAYLLSLPPDYETTIDEIAGEARGEGSNAVEGRDALRKAARELERAGYLARTRWQDGRGHWHTDVAVYSTPGRADDGKSVPGSTSENTASQQVAPTTGNPTVGGSVVNKKTDPKNESHPPPSPPADLAPQKEEEGGDGTTRAARELVGSLPDPWRLGPRAVERLTPLAARALRNGWDADWLADRLARNPHGVNHPESCLRARLDDLPHPPAPARPAHCGQCHESTRMCLDKQERPYRCPACHPLMVGGLRPPRRLPSRR